MIPRQILNSRTNLFLARKDDARIVKQVFHEIGIDILDVVNQNEIILEIVTIIPNVTSQNEIILYQLFI